MVIGPHEIDHPFFVKVELLLSSLCYNHPLSPLYFSPPSAQNSEYYFGRGFLKTLSSLATQMSVKPAVSTGRFQEGSWLGSVLQSIQVILSYLFQDTFNV